jgi:hypothetical protein
MCYNMHTKVNKDRYRQNPRVLMMVYNTQNYWVSGLCSSSGIPNTRQHVLETGSVRSF